jgi:hypothetical protein
MRAEIADGHFFIYAPKDCSGDFVDVYTGIIFCGKFCLEKHIFLDHLQLGQTGGQSRHDPPVESYA